MRINLRGHLFLPVRYSIWDRMLDYVCIQYQCINCGQFEIYVPGLIELTAMNRCGENITRQDYQDYMLEKQTGENKMGFVHYDYCHYHAAVMWWQKHYNWSIVKYGEQWHVPIAMRNDDEISRDTVRRICMEQFSLTDKQPFSMRTIGESKAKNDLYIAWHFVTVSEPYTFYSNDESNCMLLETPQFYQYLKLKKDYPLFVRELLMNRGLGK